jgi:multidrug efflux pump subunit AcrA (membrane-fusion protein)
MTLSSEVNARAELVNYDVGGTIGKLPLIELDTAFIEQALNSAEARLLQLEVSLERAEARALYLEREFNRIDMLHRDDRATGIRRDASEQEMVQARLGVSAVRAELAVARATFNELDERRERHYIFAPKGWVVIARMVEPGEVVSPGKPIAQAADFRRLVVPFAVSMEELEALKAIKGDIEVRVEGTKARARINWINPAFDEQTRKTHLELSLRSYKGEKRGGLKVTVPLKVKAEGLLVPKAALVSRYGNPRVKLAASGEMVQVIIISESTEHVFVASGDARLAPGVELMPAGEKR